MLPNEKMAKKKLYPMVKLSKQSQTLLEELMLEGWIIDVEMEEMAEISHLIFCSQVSHKCINYLLKVVLKFEIIGSC